MPEDDSSNLLDQFLSDRSERAFRALVQRYLPLVHAVAFRSLRDAELAKEVSQQVFIRLAARAHGIRQECGLVAWLHRTAHSLAVDAVRREQRRKLREQKAAAMSSLSSSASPEVAWESLAPVLDDLLNRLPEDDRRVILLRYYENRPLAFVAASLGIQEKAAAKRSARALERLRALFAKRGIATSSSALATLLPLHAAPTAPAGLAAVISASSFSAAPASLFTWFAMTTTTKLVLGSAALLSLAWLYFESSQAALHRAREASPGTPGHSAAAASSMSAVRPARPEPSSVSDLDEIAKISNFFERSRALDAMLSNLPAPSYAGALAKLVKLGFEPNSGEVRMLLSHWCQLDAPAAYAFSLGKEGRSQPQFIAMILGEWGKRDFEAAFAATMNLPPSQSFSCKQALQELLLTIAASDPSRAFASLGESMDKLDFTYASTIAAGILEKNPGKLRELADGIPAGVDRNEWLLPYAAGASFGGAKLPEQWLHSKAPDYRMAANRKPGPIAPDDQIFVAEWIAENPETALACSQLDSGNLFHSLALADHDQAVRIAAEIPESAASLREEVRRAIGIAEDPSTVPQPAIDE
ncbi:MAG: hypothetical protein JWO82_3009 [Akkermansiaceae bacterium]|nr:hypothetical protein [Akkermansiaceae bacterium]